MKVVEFFIPLPESPNFESILDLQSVIIYSRPSRGFIVDDFERGAKQLGCTVGITVG